MKELFVVKDSANRICATTDNKVDAKVERDLLGGVAAGYRVSRGKDHIGKHGHTIRPMRLQPKLINKGVSK